MNSIPKMKDRLLEIIDEFEDGNKSKFAREIGASSGNLGIWLRQAKRGKEIYPSASVLYRILKRYSVNINWLLTGEGKKTLKKITRPTSINKS